MPVKNVPITERHPGRSFASVEGLLYNVKGSPIASRRVHSNKTWLERLDSEGLPLDQRMFDRFWPEHNMTGAIGLRLHDTHVLVWWPNDTVSLNAADGAGFGWYTMTTRERMNTWLPYDYERRCLYVTSDRNSMWVVWTALGAIPYHDNMVLDLTTWTEFSPQSDHTPEIASNEATKREIDNYLRWVRRNVSTGLATVGSIPDKIQYFEETPHHMLLTIVRGRAWTNILLREACELDARSSTMRMDADDLFAHILNSVRQSGEWALFLSVVRKYLRARLYQGPRSIAVRRTRWPVAA